MADKDCQMFDGCESQIASCTIRLPLPGSIYINTASTFGHLSRKRLLRYYDSIRCEGLDDRDISFLSFSFLSFSCL